MTIEQILNTKCEVTDEELKAVAYGLEFGQFGPVVRARQIELLNRLRKLEDAEKAAMRERVSSKLDNSVYFTDDECDEHAWS